MIYELHKNKLHILNFAVCPSHRRIGIGRQMIAKLIGKLSSHRRTRITLAVRETNLTAQLFFQKQEFKAVKVLRNYYEDSGEDAYLMHFAISEDAGDDAEGPVNRIAQYEENCEIWRTSDGSVRHPSGRRTGPFVLIDSSPGLAGRYGSSS
jgi:ribosomal-protein-alanine N-acetyltransferase